MIRTEYGQVKKYVEWCEECYEDDPIMENYIWFCETKKCLKKCREAHMNCGTHNLLIKTE